MLWSRFVLAVAAGVFWILAPAYSSGETLPQANGEGHVLIVLAIPTGFSVGTAYLPAAALSLAGAFRR